MENYGVVQNISFSGNRITITFLPEQIMYETSKVKNKIITLTAVGECCSTSNFIIESNLILNLTYDKIYENLIKYRGRTLVNILLDIDMDDNMYNLFGDPSEYDSMDSVKFRYNKLIFSDNTELPFLLINESNGYYDGWTEISTNYAEFDKNKNESNIMILIGLPGSGKTTFTKNYFDKNNDDNNDNNIFIFDDIISNCNHLELLEKISNISEKTILVTDPRFCIQSVFTGFMQQINIFIKKDKIKLLLFENNKDKCFENLKIREKELSRLEKFNTSLNNLANKYDVNHECYKNYFNVVIPVNTKQN